MRKKLLFFILFVLMITGIAVGIHDYFHWQVMLTTETFTESTEKIWNPNRGFYHIYGFLISDEPADMSEQLDRQMQKDTDHALAMAQTIRAILQKIGSQFVQNRQICLLRFSPRSAIIIA